MHVFAPLLWLSFFGSAAGFAGSLAPAAGADAEADPESSVQGMDCTIASASSNLTHRTSKKSKNPFLAWNSIISQTIVVSDFGGLHFAFPALRANASV